MGNEALCRVAYGGEAAEAKVLLETEEIIVRGAMKLRIPFKEGERVAADGGALTFRPVMSSSSLLPRVNNWRASRSSGSHWCRTGPSGSSGRREPLRSSMPTSWRRAKRLGSLT